MSDLHLPVGEPATEGHIESVPRKQKCERSAIKGNLETWLYDNADPSDRVLKDYGISH